VITRRITSLAAAAKDNGDSRIFGGVSIFHYYFGVVSLGQDLKAGSCRRGANLLTNIVFADPFPICIGRWHGNWCEGCTRNPGGL
jgi:hypothetical protein